MPDQLQRMEGKEVVSEIEPASGVVASRERAVSRILRGSGTVISGGALFSVGYWGVFDSVGLTLGSVLGGFVLGGAGLVMVGLAASHLFRFGKARPTLILGSAAGVGVSVGFMALAAWMSLIPGVPNPPGLLMISTFFSALGFGTLLVLLVLGAAVRWVFDLHEADTVLTGPPWVGDSL